MSESRGPYKAPAANMGALPDSRKIETVQVVRKSDGHRMRINARDFSGALHERIEVALERAVPSHTGLPSSQRLASEYRVVVAAGLARLRKAGVQPAPASSRRLSRWGFPNPGRYRPGGRATKAIVLAAKPSVPMRWTSVAVGRLQGAVRFVAILIFVRALLVWLSGH